MTRIRSRKQLDLVVSTIKQAFARGGVQSQPMNAAMSHTLKDGIDIRLDNGTPATVYLTGEDGKHRTATVEVRPENAPYPFLANFDITLD